MNHTKIEWVKNPDGSQGYTWNPITGCLNGCEYCYARKLANTRLRERYLANVRNLPQDIPGEHIREGAFADPFYPRFWQSRLNDPLYGNPKGIFVCDMGELFGPWLPDGWTNEVFHTINRSPQHRFYLLTKQPQNLAKWSPFPENCWVGVSVTRNSQLDNALKYLKQIQATVKFISFEPLLERIDLCANICHNPVYEDNKSTREQGLQGSIGRRAGDRQRGKSMEGCSTSLRQMEGWEQGDTLQASQGGELHRAISSSSCDVQQSALPCPSPSFGIPTFLRGNSSGNDSEPSERDKRRQQTKELRVSDILTTDETLDKNSQKGEMPTRASERRSEANTKPSDGNQETPCQRREIDINRTGLQCPPHNHIQNCAQENLGGISWIILGAQTKPYKPPEISWVKEIIEAANVANIPVFLKDNLSPLFDDEAPDCVFEKPLSWEIHRRLRQEMPK